MHLNVVPPAPIPQIFTGLHLDLGMGVAIALIPVSVSAPSGMSIEIHENAAAACYKENRQLKRSAAARFRAAGLSNRDDG
jgi:hypothetical protein